MKVDGKQIAQTIFDDLIVQVRNLKKKGVTPHLIIVLIGNDPASQAYVKQKVLKGQAIGIKTTVHNLEFKIKNLELLELIKKLNNNKNVHGIIVQRPLPPHIDEQTIDEAVALQKDVDGFHPQTPFGMPLALAALKILEEVSYSVIPSEVEESLSQNSGARVPSTRPAASVGMTWKQINFLSWLKTKKVVVIGKGKTGGGPIIADRKSVV